MLKHKRELFIDALHIFILFSLALSRPLYILSHNAEFFVAHHVRAVDVVLFILIQSLLLPVIVVLIEAMVGLSSRRLRKGIHYFIVSCLLSVIALTVLKQNLQFSGMILLTGAAIIGFAITLTYIRFQTARNFLTFLLPAVFIFPYLFLFQSPVHKIVFPGEKATTATVEIGNPVPIVMVVFDEFPVTSLMDEDHQIDPVRYPNFAALAKDSYWFRNATTVSDHTHIAIPAIMTGRYPELNKLPNINDHPLNLFTILGNSYDLHVYESMTRLCPERLCGKDSKGRMGFIRRVINLLSDLYILYLHIFLPHDFTGNLAVVTQSWKDFKKKAVATKDDGSSSTTFLKGIRKLVNVAIKEIKKDRAEVFRDFINSIKLTNKPNLYFIHCYLPHVPWVYLPSGKKHSLTINRIKGLNKEWWDKNEFYVLEAYQLHLLQVGFVDKLLGELMDRLKEIGLYNKSLIVITADHGVSFRTNNSRRYVNKGNYQDIMPVPLFIKLPYQKKGIVSDRNVETIDILPSILYVLDVSISEPFDGSSVFDTSTPERNKKIIYAKQSADDKYEFSAHLDIAVREAIKRKVNLFGSGDIWPELLMSEIDKELVGHPIKDFQIRKDREIKVDIEQSALLSDVETGSSFLPAYIKGRILGKDTFISSPRLAITLNDIVYAVTKAFVNEGNKAEFSAIMPEMAFRDGMNKIDVFSISEDNGAILLRRLEGSRSIKYRLVSTGDSGEIIKTSIGTSFKVKPHHLKAYLDSVEVDSEHVVLSGWAADVKNLLPADAIVIFSKGESIYYSGCNEERPDIVRAYNSPDIINTGFRYVVPISLFKNREITDMRIFAISERGVASELTYPIDYKWGKKL